MEVGDILGYDKLVAAAEATLQKGMFNADNILVIESAPLAEAYSTCIDHLVQKCRWREWLLDSAAFLKPFFACPARTETLIPWYTWVTYMRTSQGVLVWCLHNKVLVIDDKVITAPTTSRAARNSNAENILFIESAPLRPVTFVALAKTEAYSVYIDRLIQKYGRDPVLRRRKLIATANDHAAAMCRNMVSCGAGGRHRLLAN